MDTNQGGLNAVQQQYGPNNTIVPFGGNYTPPATPAPGPVASTPAASPPQQRDPRALHQWMRQMRQQWGGMRDDAQQQFDTAGNQFLTNKGFLNPDGTLNVNSMYSAIGQNGSPLNYLQSQGLIGSNGQLDPNKMYDSLGQTPDAPGLNYWTSQWANGGDPTQEAKDFYTAATTYGSDPSYAPEVQKAQGYLGQLNSANPGVNYWQNQFSGGGDPTQEAQQFFSSQGGQSLSSQMPSLQSYWNPQQYGGFHGWLSQQTPPPGVSLPSRPVGGLGIASGYHP